MLDPTYLRHFIKKKTRAKSGERQLEMACFMKLFKAQKSFDLPVFDSVPGTISKVIILHNL